jgi:hypothetical protein
MLYSDFIIRNTNKMKNQVPVLTAADNRKHVNTLILTLLQSKSVSGVVPMTQSPETNANLTIRPKTIISNMLVSIPIIYENM